MQTKSTSMKWLGADTIASRLRRTASAAAIAAFGLMPAQAALAQTHGGGGFHGGGGGAGGYHGGYGGGYHGGYHGGGFYGHGYYGHGFYGGWGCCGWYGGFWPGFWLGGYDAFDPFWAYGPYGYDVDASYDAPPPGYVAGAYAPSPAYGAQGPAYSAQGPAYGAQGTAAVTPGSGGMPTDNSRGFYRWPVGVEGGTCNRAYLQQAAISLGGAGAGSGAYLGGIAVAPVIGGRVGGQLDMADQACATETLERAQTGSTVSWQTAAGVPVTLEVTRTATKAGDDCRDYVATAQVTGHVEKTRGKACKQPNGSWVAAG